MVPDETDRRPLDLCWPRSRFEIITHKTIIELGCEPYQERKKHSSSTRLNPLAVSQSHCSEDWSLISLNCSLSSSLIFG